MHKNWLVVATIALVASGGFAFAEDAVDPAAVKSEDGKYLDKEGSPTFKIASDGTVDWYTYSGYRRYPCYMDDLYVYLRARAYDAVGRVRPAKHEDKPPAAQQAEDSCMGKR